jgi:hypothetical protein
MRFRHSARLGGLLLVGAVGCGLISSDITKLTFDLPRKTYTFDSASFANVTAGIPAVPCGGDSPILGIAAPDCAAHPIVCEAGLCTLKQPVTVSQKMDLKKEVPQLSSVDNQSLADITLTTMHYEATSTLNVDVPAIELYLAPDGVTDPNDPQAAKFGTVPPIAANETVSGNVEKEPGADDLFASYGHAFGTPFNFIATTTVSVASGSPTPSGKITIVVEGKVSAKLSL